jgi:hypothetical protein
VSAWKRERDEAKAEVLHWREARQAALEGGDILKAEVERLRAEAEVERLTADVTWLHTVAQGVAHYAGCSESAPCLRCQNEQLRAMLPSCWACARGEVPTLDDGLWMHSPTPEVGVRFGCQRAGIAGLRAEAARLRSLWVVADALKFLSDRGEIVRRVWRLADAALRGEEET